MSQWTHIRGGMELSSSAFEYKGKNNTAYLPYPEEQFVVLPPTIFTTYDEGWKPKDHKLGFKCIVRSLPRARKYLDEAFKLLPNGEVGIVYSPVQDDRMCYCSSSNFDHPCEKKCFKAAINKMYNKLDSPLDNYTYSELKRVYGIEMAGVDYVTGFTIGIRDDLRCASGESVMEGLEKFFDHLYKNRITVEDGYLEWEDEYNSGAIWAWRSSRLNRTEFSFLKLDKKTNKILWSKDYKTKDIKSLELISEEKTYE